jgi:hypothetical protein
MPRPKLAAYPRAALFASSLARDVKTAAETIETECAALRLVEQSLIGLPRVANIGGVADVARD